MERITPQKWLEHLILKQLDHSSHPKLNNNRQLCIYQYIYIAGGREKAKLHTSTPDRDGPSFGLLILHLVALNNCEQNSTHPRLLGGSFCVATGTEKTLVKKFPKWGYLIQRGHNYDCQPLVIFGRIPIYPLVNVYIAMENHHAINGKIHEINGDFQ